MTCVELRMLTKDQAPKPPSTGAGDISFRSFAALIVDMAGGYGALTASSMASQNWPKGDSPGEIWRH